MNLCFAKKKKLNKTMYFVKISWKPTHKLLIIFIISTQQKISLVLFSFAKFVFLFMAEPCGLDPFCKAIKLRLVVHMRVGYVGFSL